MDSVVGRVPFDSWYGSRRRGEEAVGDQLGRRGVRETVDEDDQLVSAEPCDRVAGPGHGSQSRRRLPDQLVADRMPQRCR